MAIRKTGTILVKGKSGNKAKIVLPGCQSLVAAKAFLTSIETVAMKGKGIAACYAENEKIAAEITDGNTDRKGIIIYQDNDASTTKRISIPSWGDDAGDVVLESGGERIPLVMCQSVVEALETASGRSLTALEGYVIQKK